MSTFIRKVKLFIVFAASIAPFSADAERVIDGYIRQAFASNEALKQENLKLDNALNALKQARSLYYPNVALQGNYTRAAGGRTIDFPIGDLLNPVYGTLNELTKSNSFPRVNNASFLLNPNDFYDLKFHTTLPLINAEIWYNQRIKKAAIGERQAAVNVYKRELAKNIKAAYYQYYTAVTAAGIYDHALELIRENVRVNKSLVKNGVKNNTVLLRAQAEEQKTASAATEAQNNIRNARLYFNFLLNREGESDIVLDSAQFADAMLKPGATSAAREELTQLQSAVTMYGLGKQLQRSYLVPKLNLFMDLGSQAYSFRFDDKSRYFFGGLSLQWDLFAAGLHKYRTAEAATNLGIARSNYEYSQQAIAMQTAQAENNYHTAYASFRSAGTQVQYAMRYYDDEMKLYKEGEALYIELIDALNQLTTARLQENLARAAVLTAIADLERQHAGYDIENAITRN